MPLIPFPNVPNVPGVPAVPRSSNFPPAAQFVLGVAQGILWSALQTDRRWGIFDQNGKPLVDSANFVAVALGLGSSLSTNTVDYSKESRLSDFPVERGSFAQYNKVETPGMATVSLAYGGNEQDRATFLAVLDAAAKSVDLYDIVTPEVTYIQYNIESYNYQRRAERGATLLIVELVLKEIRQVSAQYTTNGQISAPASPNAAAKISAGKVQPLNPVQSVLHAIGKTLTKLASSVF